MPLSDKETLSPEIRIALAHSPAAVRGALEAFFALDQRLARIVSQTSEPMLGQMRLAWWREALAKPGHERPAGDAVLDAIGAEWAGREAALIELVDGWEHLIGEEALTEKEVRLFAAGRQSALLAVYGQAVGGPGKDWPAYGTAAWFWAISDLAANVSDESERRELVKLGLANERANIALPRAARGLAILGALGHRALKAGGRPLMEGRGAALTAMRVAIFGR